MSNNRIIKFRAWDKEHKRMWNGGFWVGSNYGDIFTVSPDTTISQLNQAQPRIEKEKNLILMQYTGLKDKNGKEIYEGDIVKFWDEERRRVIQEKVYFENGAFWVNGREGRKDWGIVIGNIYQNKDLLK